MATLDHTLEPDITVRRLEVITGTGRRRHFSVDDKARVVEETLLPGAVVSEVARRHGLMPQQVFTWRRQARSSSKTMTFVVGRLFVHVASSVTDIFEDWRLAHPDLLKQIWPIRRNVIGWPPKVSVTDRIADDVAGDFHRRSDEIGRRMIDDTWMPYDDAGHSKRK